LTLPIILYSYFTEGSNLKATIGKKVVKLIVIAQDNETKKEYIDKESIEIFTLGNCSYWSSLVDVF